MAAPAWRLSGRAGGVEYDRAALPDQFPLDQALSQLDRRLEVDRHQRPDVLVADHSKRRAAGDAGGEQHACSIPGHNPPPMPTVAKHRSGLRESPCGRSPSGNSSVWSRRSTLRPLMTRLAPRLEHATAVPRPIPDDAPVTRIVLPTSV